MRPGFPALACLITVAAGDAGAAAVGTAPADDAEVFVRRGIAFRKELKDQQALEAFQRAYQLTPTPRIEAQIAVAEQALGRWIDAEIHLTGALAATTDDWIGKNRQVLERAMVTIRTHLGSLEIVGGPPGAAVRVDGRDMGKIPLAPAVRVQAGSVVLEVTAPGYFPVSRTIVVAANSLTRETVVLLPSPGSAERLTKVTGEATATKASRPGATNGESDPTVGENTAQMTPPRTTPGADPESRVAPSDDTKGHDEGSWRRPLAWTLTGGSVVFATGGVLALIVRDNRASDYNRQVDSTGCAGPAAATCAELRSDGDLARTLAIVSFSVAGAMAVGATVLFLTAPRAAGVVSTALGACSIDRTGRGIACGAAF